MRIRDGDGEAEFSIVPAHEADIATRRVSAESPIGRALLGCRPGDDVRFRAPDGVIVVSLLDVSDADRS